MLYLQRAKKETNDMLAMPWIQKGKYMHLHCTGGSSAAEGGMGTGNKDAAGKSEEDVEKETERKIEDLRLNHFDPVGIKVKEEELKNEREENKEGKDNY